VQEAGLMPLAPPRIGGLQLKLVLLADMSLIGCASLAAFVAAGWALRMEEWRLSIDWLRPRAAGFLGRLRGRRA
jgi:hypothetical protein